MISVNNNNYVLMVLFYLHVFSQGFGVYYMVFFMVFFLHCLSNSTIKVMKGQPWQIGVAKDHAIKRPRKDLAKKTMRKDHENEKRTNKDHEKRP